METAIIDKKASAEILRIKNAESMLTVFSAVQDALPKIFDLHNFGLETINMRKQGMSESEILTIRDTRMQQLTLHNKEAQIYLLSFISYKLKRSLLYVNSINRLNGN